MENLNNEERSKMAKVVITYEDGSTETTVLDEDTHVAVCVAKVTVENETDEGQEVNIALDVALEGSKPIVLKMGQALIENSRPSGVPSFEEFKSMLGL